MDSYWYKEAIIYELHVKCFCDSSGDGIGDFCGLTKKLDYLVDLGVSALWILPFYPSPLKDDGYDISDYTGVHPYYGNLKDFKEFLTQAHQRGLKVITELVINHTSDQHPWFQRARKKEASPEERNFYVWSDNPEKYDQARIIFQDFEASNWTWDKEAHSYYWHRFYSHQPDLNYDHPSVHRAIFQNLSFWFKMGVDGLRLDAVPYLYEREGTNCENLPETHSFLKKLRSYIDTHFPGKMLLAEANQWPEDAVQYLGEGDECHMAFHFPVMPRLFMSIHLEDSLPIIEIMEQTPAIPDNCQWALFLRNHDELTLEMVTDEERDYMYRVYAYDPQARLNLGIRRRLAPLLKNDRRKIELMNLLLFSLHGTPVLYYGDEIGMGDNIYLGDRNGVRTPMQWSSDRNAGFSKANPQQLYLPPIIDPEYHYEIVNVEAQMNNPFSLLWWIKQLISLRKRYKAFSYGETLFLSVANRKVLVFLRKYENEVLLIIANLSRFSQYTEVDLKEYVGYSLIEIFSGEHFPEIKEQSYFLTLGAYGYYWFSLQKQEKLTSLEQIKIKKEKEVYEYTFFGSKEKIFSENRILASLVRKYLFKRRWFQKFLPNLESTKFKIADHVLLNKIEKWHLIFVQLPFIHGIFKCTPLILKIFEGDHCQEILEKQPEMCVSLITNSKSKQVIVECDLDEKIVNYLLDIIKNEERVKTDCGELRGVKFTEFTTHSRFKIYRTLENEIDPDVEMRSFLARYTSFKSFLHLTGCLEYREEGSKEVVLAEVFEPPSSAFNAREFFIEGAMHFLQRREVWKEKTDKMNTLQEETLCTLASSFLDYDMKESLGEFAEISSLLGKTTADFHNALCSLSFDPNFAPMRYTLFYQRSLYQGMWRKVNEAFSYLSTHRLFPEILPLKSSLLNMMGQLPRIFLQVSRIRCHGNYVLENLFYTGKEFIMTNFGSHDALSVTEKKYKRSPLRDIASLLLSISEASLESVHKLICQGVISDKEYEKFKKQAMDWSIQVGTCFLKSYLTEFKNSDFLPEKKEELDFLLGIFLLERCVEKIPYSEPLIIEAACYTMQHWLSIYETHLEHFFSSKVVS